MVDPNYFRSYAALATLTTGGALYYSYHNVSIDTIPVTERRRLRFIGPKLSSIISETSVASLIEQYKGQGALLEDENKYEVCISIVIWFVPSDKNYFLLKWIKALNFKFLLC